MIIEIENPTFSLVSLQIYSLGALSNHKYGRLHLPNTKMSDKDLKDNSNIPILNGTNYSEWYRRTRIYLRSKDLLDVSLNSIPPEATPAIVNKWKKTRCDAVSFISSKIDPSVFIEVVDDETMKDAHLLWEKINEQYASKTAINRGRVVMNWVSISYKGNTITRRHCLSKHKNSS
ncbi:hypothetical protein O181_100116 [Austropuccinia psidii MF-1]|uniref:Retrotransposon Copia-like N-terminal domain-containing protein n=1 Tax=Austropuccinia psidii MF-1 TaxID=1389203 RepID=A0A9Q3JES2_9BASI|nr:hypothetical protein [Austropuccinia psidii MF-1]